MKVDQTYITPAETHNPIELHASVAHVGRQGRFTLYETNQAIMNYRTVMAQMLGVPEEHVHVITEYLGSGFGGKLWPWPHALLAAMAARDLELPIKLVVTREQMFHDVGHRPHTQQRMRLGATADGKLVSLQQDLRLPARRGWATTRKNAAKPPAFSTARRTCASPRPSPGATWACPPPCAVPAPCPACSRWSRRWTSWRSR